MKRWIFTVLCLLIIFPGSALAQSTIEVDAKDNPLQIRGWLNEKDSLLGSIRLTAPTAVEQLTFLASDLKRQEGDGAIARQQIQFIGEPKLKAGIPKDFQVKVSNAELPGIYQGQIQVLLPGQQRKTIPLTVLVKARPNLKPLSGNEQIQLKLTQCSWWLDCGLARLLLPASAFLQQWDLAFDNSVDAPVKVTGAEVVLKGEQTGYQLTKTQIQLPNIPQSLAADQIVHLLLTWERSQIPPDRYMGAVYLTLEDANERLILPVNLTIRIAPLMPLLVLFLGIVLGRLVKYMQEKGIPQTEALGKVKELEQQIDKANERDRDILTSMVGKAKQLVQQMKLEAATAEVEKISARLDCLEKLRTLEQKLEPFKTHPQVKGDTGILKKISDVRTKIELEQDEQAKTLLEEVQADIAKLKSSSTMMGPGQTPDIKISEVVKGVTDAAVAVSNAVQSGVKKSGLQRSLIFLSGSEFRTEATYWFARPLFSLALLIGFSVVGIRALYVEKGATFGADPFSDYWGLVLWGLSADIASRSLSNLTGEEKQGTKE
ncbi:hypothetical protein QUA56_16150 [Microcoleus sp. N3A4]|uniref:hypothetical protein n=1 Tax=Microcoleus sp. N3A4 TaxID=3055379 RepID=UPI002FCE9E16